MKKYNFLLFLCLLLGSCESIDSLTPEGEANLGKEDIRARLEAAYINWWNANHNPNTVLSLSVAADAYGLSRGNFGTVEMGNEPRKSYDNHIGNYIAENAWYDNLKAVAQANQVIRNFKDDKSESEALAAAHFLRGIAWGYLGLIFDKVILVDSVEQKEITFVAYPDVVAAAVQELEQAIELAETTSDFQHDYLNGIILDQSSFIALAHSYAARFTVQMARTEEERQKTSWELAYYHANRGITKNFAPSIDGNNWQSYQQYSFAEAGNGPFWARVDQRLIAAMDEQQPTRYPAISTEEQAAFNPIAQSDDARLESDFIFQDRIFFKEELGTWHFSHYQHNRNQTDALFSNQMPTFLVTDNLLLKAEAALSLGGKAEAIQLLNESARVQRGQLSALPGLMTYETILEIIKYERSIELLGSAPMSLWFDRRRWAKRETPDSLTALGGLQINTPAHLPVPARELQLHNMEIYTFGGENDPEGIQPVQ